MARAALSSSDFLKGCPTTACASCRVWAASALSMVRASMRGWIPSGRFFEPGDRSERAAGSVLVVAKAFGDARGRRNAPMVAASPPACGFVLVVDVVTSQACDGVGEVVVLDEALELSAGGCPVCVGGAVAQLDPELVAFARRGSAGGFVELGHDLVDVSDSVLGLAYPGLECALAGGVCAFEAHQPLHVRFGGRQVEQFGWPEVTAFTSAKVRVLSPRSFT